MRVITKDIMKQPEYDFLRQDEELNKRIVLFGISGSHAYGTNNQNSDIDLRGIMLNRKSDLLGMTSLDQYEDPNTDTVIYSFNKAINLWINASPYALDILGMHPDNRFIITDIGKEILEQRHIFLSKKVARSYMGLVDGQWKKLLNVLSVDMLEQEKKEQIILDYVCNSISSINSIYDKINKGNMRLYIDKAEKPDLEYEIFIDAVYNHCPLRDFDNINKTMADLLCSFDKMPKRKVEKDDNLINKQAMHMLRLLMVAIDILKEGEIILNREEEHDLLMSIRNGDFRTDDGMFKQEYLDLLMEYKRLLKIAAEKSSLPDSPDMNQIEIFMERINEKVIYK